MLVKRTKQVIARHADVIETIMLLVSIGLATKRASLVRATRWWRFVRVLRCMMRMATVIACMFNPCVTQSLPRVAPAAEQLQKLFIAMNGHLLLFSAWLQHPEPPATQAMPFEDRSFFGVVDSLLQIKYGIVCRVASLASSLMIYPSISTVRFATVWMFLWMRVNCNKNN